MSASARLTPQALVEYQTELTLRLLPQPNEKLSRIIGHAHSTIVDTIYGHTVDSELAGVSERVAECVGFGSAGTSP